VSAQEWGPQKPRGAVGPYLDSPMRARAGDLLSGLEPQGRLGRQPVRRLTGARHSRHRRPTSEPDALPTHAPGRYHSVVPRFVNSVRDQTTGGALKIDFYSVF
jgi:hypothetical protein